jgi:hypothetical protein
MDLSQPVAGRPHAPIRLGECSHAPMMPQPAGGSGGQGAPAGGPGQDLPGTGFKQTGGSFTVTGSGAIAPVVAGQGSAGPSGTLRWARPRAGTGAFSRSGR